MTLNQFADVSETEEAFPCLHMTPCKVIFCSVLFSLLFSSYMVHQMSKSFFPKDALLTLLLLVNHLLVVIMGQDFLCVIKFSQGLYAVATMTIPIFTDKERPREIE